MNPFVANPHWGWWIVLYFFLGGIAAGAYFTSTLIDLTGPPEDHRVARVGYLIAFPLICVCGLLLTIDLERPERFWHMLFRSEFVEAALREGWPLSAAGWRCMVHAPLLKYWSPMSIGSWALTLFGLCSFFSFLGSVWPGGRLEGLLRRGLVARLVQVVGCAVGFFVASYTGALVTASNQPVWSDTPWIAPLFLTSAASTGMATMILLLHRERAAGAGLERLERADTWASVLEVLAFVGFFVSLGAASTVLLHTAHGLLIVIGTLGLGVLVPLVWRTLGGRSRSLLAPAGLALIGGFLLRYALIGLPSELLARNWAQPGSQPGPVVARNFPAWAGFSPEDGRQHGARGADPGNYTADLEPRSKVFHEP